MNSPSKHYSVIAVIVNYNSFVDCTRCCESLLALAYPGLRVVVLDNGSPDGSGVALKAWLEPRGIDCILIPENGGFAAANNIGLHYSLSLDPDFVWLLNADTTVESQSLDALLSAAEQFPEVGAFGSKVLYGGRSEQNDVIWGAGAQIDFKKQSVSMCGADERDTGQYETSVECGYLPGCAVFARAAVVAHAGYLPEEYFMYFEETEWCTRIRRLGYSLRYVPKSIVRHHFAPNKMQDAFGVYYYNRNSRLFWYRHGTLTQRVSLIVDTCCRAFPRALYAFYKAPDAQLRRVFLAHVASCVDFLSGRYGKRTYFHRS